MRSQLDVIIPVFNEAENVDVLVRRLAASLTSAQIPFALYFVDDHSTDNTVELLKKLAKKFPITVLTKKGKKGKAFSILEGAKASKAQYLAMIDADLQYPPEVIPQMFEQAKTTGMSVANRQTYQESQVRRTLSRGFQWFFGKVLHGLDCDVQSGLKVFNREIIKNITKDEVTPWTLDIPLLTTTKQMGFSISSVNIEFEKRSKGESKIHLSSSIREIGGQAIRYKLKGNRAITHAPASKTAMTGAGLTYKGKKFVTHTTLTPAQSALHVITGPQRLFIGVLLALAIIQTILNPMFSAKVIVAILSIIYFSDVFFNLFVILKSLYKPPEITIPTPDLEAIKDKDLPIYTVLCPLYKEAHVIPQFLAAIKKLDWPKQKLDVILLLEADDEESIEAVKEMDLPKYVTVQVVPDSQPKTKPKACNYGLSFAKGEYLVIYDAEDSPDPLQLKKVYAAFQRVPSAVKCIQAKLNFYNPHQNLLTRFFTAEYSLWFDVVLTGLQSIQTTIPLGGTSNHFRTQELRDLEGWDPFNVTEDCDLGIRLFKRGALTAIIDSVTLEEANSSWRNWLRQRSRWIKGYMQTYLVHMRHPVRFFREHGLHALLFQLVVGGKIAFMLINPFMWLLTITYFALYAWVGPTVQSLYPSAIFYMAVTSLLFGNFFFMYYYMIGAAKREHWSIIKWVFLVPVYWLMVSVAAGIALYQLIVKPHYWEKTIHGLHMQRAKLDKKVKEVATEVIAEAAAHSEEKIQVLTQVTSQATTITPLLPLKQHSTNVQKLQKILTKLSPTDILKFLNQPMYQRGMFLIVATVVANVINLVVNLYLGRKLSFADFGVFNVMMSLFYLANIPIQALGSTVSYKSSFLLGKHKTQSLLHFWKYIHTRVLIVGVPLTLVWIVLSPWLSHLFGDINIFLFVLFATFWLSSLSFSVNQSYLSARLLFQQVAVLTLAQPLLRLIGTAVLASVAPAWTFGGVLISLIGVSFISYFMARKGSDTVDAKHEFHLPRNFYFASLMAGISTIAFFSLDNIVIAQVTNAEVTGQYAFMGLFGKMVFFVGSLTTTFLAPFVARREGAGKDSRKLFLATLLSVVAMTIIGYVVFIIGAMVGGEIFFGEKIRVIQSNLLLYGLGIAAFTIAQVIVGYHLVKKHYFFPTVSLFLSVIQIISLVLFHRSLTELTWVMTIIGVSYLVVFALLHVFHVHLAVIFNNAAALLGLFQKIAKPQTRSQKNLKILFFNWRDTKHAWAGGAEVYVHQIAKRLVAKGHQVTVFCGTDGHSSPHEVVEGVHVIRRGGFYTMYFWAFVYYIFKLRGRFDIIIDCENGIPFLTPFFVRKPILLLIFHIHRDVFTKHLPLPLTLVARSLEELVMPLLYRDKSIITISQSSKTAIAQLGISHPDQISIVYPGATVPKGHRTKQTKTKYPSFCYVGRLKPYKNVDVAIKAFFAVVEKYPKAIFTIAGVGESQSELQSLVSKLGIEKNVIFRNKVSEEEKHNIYATHWVALQPSMMEGWGITVIEANLSHTPVIAAKVSGLKDSVSDGHTGILVPPRNISALSEAMFELIKNTKLRNKLGSAAFEWAQAFSWDKSAQKIEETIFAQLHQSVSDQKAEVQLAYQEEP